MNQHQTSDWMCVIYLNYDSDWIIKNRWINRVSEVTVNVASTSPINEIIQHELMNYERTVNGCWNRIGTAAHQLETSNRVAGKCDQVDDVRSRGWRVAERVAAGGVSIRQSLVLTTTMSESTAISLSLSLSLSLCPPTPSPPLSPLLEQSVFQWFPLKKKRSTPSTSCTPHPSTSFVTILRRCLLKSNVHIYTTLPSPLLLPFPGPAPPSLIFLCM